MTVAVPLGVLALVAYCLLCLASPTAKCPRVKVIKRKGKRPRTKRCTRCKGKGRRVRPGARLVHGIFWAACGDRVRAHFKDRYEEMTGDARDLADD